MLDLSLFPSCAKPETDVQLQYFSALVMDGKYNVENIYTKPLFFHLIMGSEVFTSPFNPEERMFKNTLRFIVFL